MPESILAELSQLELPREAREQLRISAGLLSLRRAWPRDAGHLLLEYACAGGATIAGQWFADAKRLAYVARETARSSEAPSAVITGTHVLLQARGADRQLPGLAPLVAHSAAELLVHRPERRAVVRLRNGDTRYVKVVRPERVEAITAAGMVVERAAGSAFLAPRLLSSDTASGTIVWSALSGTPLHNLIGSDAIAPVMREVGVALKALHSILPPTGCSTYSAEQEASWLRGSLVRAEEFVPSFARRIRHVVPDVLSNLARGSSPTALLHRDFFDKQVIVQPDGRLGILDFDTLAVGEPALDVANAAVHMELRAIQGLCSMAHADAAIAALIEGYRLSPSVRSRIPAYADGARLRLAFLYAYRPDWAHFVPETMIERIGKPLVTEGRSPAVSLAGR